MSVKVQTAPSTSEVTINTITGTASITRAGLSRRLNVPTQTLKDYLNRRGKTQVNQPLDEDSVVDAVAYFAYNAQNPTQEAKDLLAAISKAGAKAYLYHEAGIAMNAIHQQRPLTQLEAFKELVRLEEERIALLETVSQQSGLLVQQREVIDYKKIITGEGEEYFPISLITEHNPDRTFSGRRLTLFSAKAEIDPIPMFASKGQIPVKAYHWSVWEAAYPNVILPE